MRPGQTFSIIINNKEIKDKDGLTVMFCFLLCNHDNQPNNNKSLLGGYFQYHRIIELNETAGSGICGWPDHSAKLLYIQDMCLNKRYAMISCFLLHIFSINSNNFDRLWSFCNKLEILLISVGLIAILYATYYISLLLFIPVVQTIIFISLRPLFWLILAPIKQLNLFFWITLLINLLLCIVYESELTGLTPGEYFTLFAEKASN